MSGQNVEVELRRNGQMIIGREDGLEEELVIKDGVSGVLIAEELCERDGIGFGFAESSNDEDEIFCCEAVPTISANHRVYCPSSRCANEGGESVVRHNTLVSMGAGCLRLDHGWDFLGWGLPRILWDKGIAGGGLCGQPCGFAAQGNFTTDLQACSHSSFSSLNFRFCACRGRASFKVPPERLPRRAARGLGARSPHQTGSGLIAWQRILF